MSVCVQEGIKVAYMQPTLFEKNHVANLGVCIDRPALNYNVLPFALLCVKKKNIT